MSTNMKVFEEAHEHKYESLRRGLMGTNMKV
jgi:hypothetical protein